MSIRSASLLLVLVSFGASAEDVHQRKPDVAYVPTSPQAVEAMLRLARVKASDVVYDLGCGDGRIVIAAARLFGARGVGIDIDPVLLRRAKENARNAGVEHLVRFEQADFFQSNLGEASVVTMYLLTEVNLRLRPKLLRELKPGARLVSHTFDMGKQWKPDTVMQASPPDGSNPYLNPTIYLWIVPQRHGGGMAAVR